MANILNGFQTLEKVLQTVKLCLENLENIKASMDEAEVDASKEHVWNVVFDRIDSICFVLFLIALPVISAWSLLHGA